MEWSDIVIMTSVIVAILNATLNARPADNLVFCFIYWMPYFAITRARKIMRKENRADYRAAFENKECLNAEELNWIRDEKRGGRIC